MHMQIESAQSTSNPNMSSTGIENINKYETVYYQVYKQIDYIKKFKLNFELNNKEKVIKY